MGGIATWQWSNILFFASDETERAGEREAVDRSFGVTAQELEILLVEDDQNDAELTLMSLRKERLANKIVVVRDGAEALDFLFCRGEYAKRNFENPPRLVLLDLNLPRVSGHNVLKAIKADERTRAIPVVVLTSSIQDRDLEECYRLGVNSYIQKPVDLKKFQDTVRQFGIYWLMVNQAPPTTSASKKTSRGT
jgi:CheY-like chemotaxis protein